MNADTAPSATNTRGFGIAAGPDLALSGEVAGEAEALGYGSVWTNDTPSGDGLQTAAAMARLTQRVSIGIGALPCDRWPVRLILERLEELEIPKERLILVMGAGRSESPLQAVESSVGELRGALGASVRLGVAALGPAMCRLAGRIGDLVLLNWATPERIVESRRWISQGAEASSSERRQSNDPAGPEVVCYVRTALGPSAEARLDKEAAGYQNLPHYRRHFQAMKGAPGIAAAGETEVARMLQPYDEVLDQTVIRAVPGGPTSADFIAIAAAAAPGRKT